jgi:hypothetical protein
MRTNVILEISRETWYSRDIQREGEEGVTKETCDVTLFLASGLEGEYDSQNTPQLQLRRPLPLLIPSIPLLPIPLLPNPNPPNQSQIQIQAELIPLPPCCPDCTKTLEEALKKGEEWKEKFSRGARRSWSWSWSVMSSDGGGGFWEY